MHPIASHRVVIVIKCVSRLSFISPTSCRGASSHARRLFGFDELAISQDHGGSTVLSLRGVVEQEPELDRAIDDRIHLDLAYGEIGAAYGLGRRQVVAFSIEQIGGDELREIRGAGFVVEEDDGIIDSVSIEIAEVTDLRLKIAIDGLVEAGEISLNDRLELIDGRRRRRIGWGGGEGGRLEVLRSSRR